MLILGRDRRTRHQPIVFRLRYEGVEKKLCRALHDRICTSEEALITSELVVMPQVRAKPCATGGPETPEWPVDGSCLSPEIGVVMTNPATRAVLNTRSARAILDQL